jgi:hypothetical protein
MESQPAHVIRYGLIKCRIFFRQTREGDRHSVTIARLYRNGDSWQESSRFGRDDLLLVAKVLDLAHTWIYEHSQSQTAPQPKEQPQ